MNIFVGNLAFMTTEEELRQFFAAYGMVDRVQIVTDRETGRSRGFGFVEMPEAPRPRPRSTASTGRHSADAP